MPIGVVLCKFLGFLLSPFIMIHVSFSKKNTIHFSSYRPRKFNLYWTSFRHLLRSTISYHLQADLFLAPQIHGAINRFSVDMVLPVPNLLELFCVIALKSFISNITSSIRPCVTPFVIGSIFFKIRVHRPTFNGYFSHNYVFQTLLRREREH